VATVTQLLSPAEASFLASLFPQYVRALGTSFPVDGLAYDAATDEAAYWAFSAVLYGSGNLTVTIEWYADSSSSGDVVWGAAIAAITPNTDTQDIETKALATENTVTDSHLGTVGQRLHSCSITVSNLDSIAVGDAVWMRVRRLGADGSDTMAGDAVLTRVSLSYSDT